ncbi:hypothetical protein V5799_008293 [Amblyomma americanum]|uniref:Uncharacterized protein n=1 Tax=Amblyomma americanum TaxID=6943 RepID=A0AAQ4FDK4_AMBAM
MRQRRRQASPGTRARDAERKRWRRRNASPGTKAREAERKRQQRLAASPGAKARDAERRRTKRLASSLCTKAREADRKRLSSQPGPSTSSASTSQQESRVSTVSPRVLHTAATNYFEKHFEQNELGATCSVCDRRWFTNDLSKAPLCDILQEHYPNPDLTAFAVCQTCLHSLREGKMLPYPTTIGYVYPPMPPHLPRLNAGSNVPSTRPEAASAVDGISSQRRRPYFCKKHTTKSKGTSTSSLTHIRSSASMRSRNTQTEVCAQVDRVTQTARISIATTTQT